MAYKIEFTPLAEADLDAITEYIVQDNPEAAHRFGCELIQRTRLLSQMPHAGAPLKNRKNVRYLIYAPYLILYRADEKTQIVQILRFWHSARDFKTLRLS